MVNIEEANRNEIQVLEDTAKVFDALYINLLEGLGKTIIRDVYDSRQASLRSQLKPLHDRPLKDVWFYTPKHVLAAVNIDETTVDSTVDDDQLEEYLTAVLAAFLLFYNIDNVDNQAVVASAKTVFYTYLYEQLYGLVDETTFFNTKASRDVLTVLGGASVVGGKIVRDVYGRHYYNGLAYNGMLYAGSLAQDVLDVRRWRWQHNSRDSRALEAHQKLDGKTYTQAERTTVLANTSVSWLGSYFYTGDHRGCLCVELFADTDTSI